MKICIDPGHGGRDRGAINGGIHEADVVLVYGDALADELRTRGHQVSLTRSTDTDLAGDHRVWTPAAKSADLRRRCGLSNAVGADAFISLHCNAGYATANGAWVLYAKPSVRGKDLASKIFIGLSAIPELTDADPEHEVYSDASPAVGYTTAAYNLLASKPAGMRDVDWLAQSGLNRDAWYRTIHVLRGTKAPAALVELGFITNAADRKQLLEPETPGQVARAIAEALKWWGCV